MTMTYIVCMYVCIYVCMYCLFVCIMSVQINHMYYNIELLILLHNVTMLKAMQNLDHFANRKL